MGDGTRRNEPCWCGSNLKFKRCHGAPRRRVTESDVIEATQLAMDRKRCMFGSGQGSCDHDRIVRAHTVSRSRQLGGIAEDGHVVGWSLHPSTFIRTPGGHPTPRPIGVKKASTFYGFCDQHDSQLFRTAERRPFGPFPEVIGPLSYRAVCHELYLKEGAVEHTRLMRNLIRGGDYVDQSRLSPMLDTLTLANENGARALLEDKAVLERMLVAGDWTALDWVAVAVPGSPFMAGSSAFVAERDAFATVLQDLTQLGTTFAYVYLSIAPATDSTLFVFAWRADAEPCRSFGRALLRIDVGELPAVCFRTALLHAENVYFRPSWWDAMPVEGKDVVQNLMFVEGSQFALRDRPMTGLTALPLHMVFPPATVVASIRGGGA